MLTIIEPHPAITYKQSIMGVWRKRVWGDFLEVIGGLAVAGCIRICWAEAPARGKLGRLENAPRLKACECSAVPEREREGHRAAMDQGMERRRPEIGTGTN